MRKLLAHGTPLLLTALCLGLLPVDLQALPATVVAGTTACTAHAFDAAASLPQAARAIVCDSAEHRLLIIGDHHGGNEIPDFVAQLVEDASARRPVRLGLEIDAFELKPIQVYVASHGTAADRAALLHDGYWSAGQGRTSQAIVRLIESARKLREQGRDVAVFTMVPTYPGDAAIEKAGGSDAYWNMGIAQAIRQQLDKVGSHGMVIAFMGSAHAAYIAPARGNAATATERLLPDSPYLVIPDHLHGQAWDCSDGGCGTHVLKDKPAADDGLPMLRKSGAKPGEPVQVWVRMPALTASPPAKKREPAA